MAANSTGVHRQGLAALYSLLFPVLINFQFSLQQYINQNVLRYIHNNAALPSHYLLAIHRT